jgi:5-oxoprolinase (ATP-hydrolysing)
MTDRFRFSIDRGGTFTDIFCEIVGGAGDIKDKKLRTLKLLSEDPSNYKDAPTEGIRRMLEQETGRPHPRSEPVPTSQIEYIRMGTTVATNALLERKGERIALLTTCGFKDLQVIGNQSRPKIFDLEIRRPELLYEMVCEVDERVTLLKSAEEVQAVRDRLSDGRGGDADKRIVTGISRDQLYVEKPLRAEEVRKQLALVRAQGITSVAIVFMHSYTFAVHEELAKAVAEELGFTQISLSSEVMPMVRVVPRGCTTCVDAYLTPVIKQYLANFRAGFDAGLSGDTDRDGKDNDGVGTGKTAGGVQVSFMQSDGGLTPMDSFSGNRAILSGPAGGVVGYARTSYHHDDGPPTDDGEAQQQCPVIGFDMGGTSTDVSRYDGCYEHVFETVTAGVTVQCPQLDINTVAAGGGSRLFYRNNLFVVGPESAGAHPGPVCYRKAGYLAVTDANVMLGRIQPHLFPAIFGPNENEQLDYARTEEAFTAITKEINAALAESNSSSNNGSDTQYYSVDEVAYGYIRVANEAMARPIRNLTTMKGYDVTRHALSCFGGAGPQHCCAIAKSLGMRKIYVHRYSGILSAYGLGLADVVVEKQIPFSGESIGDDAVLQQATLKLAQLEEQARRELLSRGFASASIHCTGFLNCRYQGTDTCIMVNLPEASLSDESAAAPSSDFVTEFVTRYRREYGFELTGRAILVEDVRVRAVGQSTSSSLHRGEGSATRGAQQSSSPQVSTPTPKETVQVYFEGGRRATPVFYLSDLPSNCTVDGPAIIVQDVATVVVEPGCLARISLAGDIEITILEARESSVSCSLDPIYLSIFGHRFMGIAEQMGRTLQRTSISVNIKERLDFSCALFDPAGGLVANAPHLPVHLGAMSEAVRYQVKHWGADLVEGDVLVSNHPQLAGGSHLPDITVITPVFHEGQIAFFVASRGHHADVGGISPGSMPPLSKSLIEEGAAIVAFKLVKGGAFQEAGITELLQAPGLLPNNWGTRNLSDNLSDLRAQVAANNRGVQLMQELVGEYSLDVVKAYMGHIQDCAEGAVRGMLRKFAVQKHLGERGRVQSVDYLDDGTPICLAIDINRAEGSAVFDFTGTGCEMLGNLNAPPAVTCSAIIYCLRCLLPDSDIPLNQGCLTPITIKIPPGCVLNPSAGAAVVGGNVLTSQRVVDVVLRAFEACAASQGCMNNLTFGNATMGYYETIAGGAGAGPTWHGCSGVHTHCTNTRITDPEILEKRYPVILRKFGLRDGSGGDGMYRGGEGVERVLEFTEDLQVSILSERRAFQPYGMRGGGDGQRGVNLLRMPSGSSSGSDDRSVEAHGGEGRLISLGGKNTVAVSKGTTLYILTPGGGGYGSSSGGDNDDGSNHQNNRDVARATAEVSRTSGTVNSYQMNQESV